MTLKRLIEKNIRRFKVLIQPLYMKGEELTCPAIHIRKLTNLPPAIALPLLCGHSKGKLRCPSDLTIVLIHNYKEEPIVEKSLRYVGIDNFVVLRPKVDGAWKMAIKMLELKKYLESGACKTKYIFYIDSDDAVLRGDPVKAIGYLKEAECSFLLADTGWESGYECMPDIRRWADRTAREHGRSHAYINAGVFIAETQFLLEVVNASMEYISDDDLSSEEYWRILDEGTLCEHLPEFPMGIGCDQEILRYLNPRFYPRMKVDYKGRLSIR